MPRRVLLALTLLWVAWALHASGLIICLLRFGTVPIGRALVAAMEVFLIYLIGRGNRHARNVLALFLIVAEVGGFVVSPSELLSFANASIAVSLVALFLLYTSAVGEWFK